MPRKSPLPVRILRFAIHLSTRPYITGPLLLAALYQPSALKAYLPSSVSDVVLSPNFIRTLKVLLGLSAAGKLNEKLSDRLVNNWRPDAKWRGEKELVLITGGASGIGETMARAFAEKGARVVVLDLRAPKVAFPPNIYFYEGDVTSTSSLSAVGAEIRKEHGDPTVLINNAGIGTLETILDVKEDDLKKVFEVNTIAHFLTAKQFLPAMIKANHGHVVTIASMASFVVAASNVDYSCSKASALAFHEGLAAELHGRYNAPDVRTTSVHPSWVRTPLTTKIFENPDRKNEEVMEPEVVSNAVIKQVLSGKSGQIILPEKLTAATGVRGWPTWLQVYLRNSNSPMFANVRKD